MVFSSPPTGSPGQGEAKVSETSSPGPSVSLSLSLQPAGTEPTPDTPHSLGGGGRESGLTIIFKMQPQTFSTTITWHLAKNANRAGPAE